MLTKAGVYCICAELLRSVASLATAAVLGFLPSFQLGVALHYWAHHHILHLLMSVCCADVRRAGGAAGGGGGRTGERTGPHPAHGLAGLGEVPLQH